MAQLSSCASIAEGPIDVTELDTIVLSGEAIHELEDEALQDENILLNDLASWSYSETLTHDFLPGTSCTVGFTADIDFDARVNPTVNSVTAEEILPEEKGAFACVFSGSGLGSNSGLAVKRSTRKKATVVQCEYCGVMTKHPSKIQAHLRTHTGEKPFECLICGMRFTQRTPMRMHVRRHLKETPYVCSFGCGKSYVSNALRNAHELKVHLKERRKRFLKPSMKPPKNCFPMVSTDSSFSKEYLESRLHRSLNESVRDFASSAASDKLDEVINAVAAGISLEPPRKIRRRSAIIAECAECGLILKHPSKIKAHMRIHTGERPFECQYCCMRFATANPLRVHLRRVHTGEKPFECTWDCGRRFVSISARNEHERVVHAGLKRYQCTIADCRRLFTRRHYLRLHQTKEHNIEDATTNCFKRCTMFARRRQNVSEREIGPSFSVAVGSPNRTAIEALQVGSGENGKFITLEESVDTEELDNMGTLAGFVTRIENDEACVWIAARKDEMTREVSLDIKEVGFSIATGDWLEIALLEGDRIVECKQLKSVLQYHTEYSAKQDLMQVINKSDGRTEKFDNIHVTSLEDDIESEAVQPYHYELSSDGLHNEADIVFFEELSDDLQAILLTNTQASSEDNHKIIPTL